MYRYIRSARSRYAKNHDMTPNRLEQIMKHVIDYADSIGFKILNYTGVPMGDHYSIAPQVYDDDRYDEDYIASLYVEVNPGRIRVSGGNKKRAKTFTESDKVEEYLISMITGLPKSDGGI